MPAGLLFQQRASAVAGLLSLAALAWSCFGDLHIGPAEAIRVLLGLAALFLPIGGVVYVLLRGRTSDTLARVTLSAAAAYGLTAPLYVLCGLVDRLVPGFQYAFYLSEGLLAAGAVAFAMRNLRRHKIEHTAAAPANNGRPLVAGFPWVLVLLTALSVLVTNRYKTPEQRLADQSSQLAVSTDTSYLAALAYELDRHTPPQQQASRAGLKERAYHLFPHVTTMLIARYTGQPDMLRALLYYQFTLVDVLLCLLVFLIAQRLTRSTWAGYWAVSTIAILAVPLAPGMRGGLSYYYFTWHPQATSSLEPALLCVPQLYCALPVIFGTLLFVLKMSVRVARAQAAGILAVLGALLAAVLIRFRVQTFVILFPGMLLLLGLFWQRTRQRAFAAAGLLAVVAVGGELLEMRSSIYYPGTASLVLGDNRLAHRVHFLNAWPGSRELYWALWDRLTPGMFAQVWQVVCLTMFGITNIVGIPLAIAAGVHFVRPRTWRGETWAFSALLAWLVFGSLLGAMYLSVPYDSYSLGAQSLFMLGWYALPLLVVDVCHTCQWAALDGPVLKGLAAVAGCALVASAVVWQRTRPDSPLQSVTRSGGPVFSAEELAAIDQMRSRLPADAVLVSKTGHHPTHFAALSGTAGRRTYLEFQGLNPGLQGGPGECDDARLARIDRVWNAASESELAAALQAIGATHLVEYADQPLHCHASSSLEEFWSGPTGQVKVWTIRSSPAAEAAPLEIARRRVPPPR